jgi:hypothetical protein
MSINTWVETLAEMAADGPTLASSVTPTSILLGSAKVTLPPRFFRFPGQAVRITATGRISVLNPTPGNLTLDVRMGPTSNIIVFNGGAFALNTAAAKTNVTWWAEFLLTCRATGNGTAANLFGTGWFQSEAVNGAAVGLTDTVSLPASAPAVGTGFDSTVAMVADLFATFSVNNAANSITAHQYTFESLN